MPLSLATLLDSGSSLRCVDSVVEALAVNKITQRSWSLHLDLTWNDGNNRHFQPIPLIYNESLWFLRVKYRTQSCILIYRGGGSYIYIYIYIFLSKHVQMLMPYICSPYSRTSAVPISCEHHRIATLNLPRSQYLPWRCKIGPAFDRRHILVLVCHDAHQSVSWCSSERV